MFDARYFLFETLASMYAHDDEPSCITSTIVIYNNGFGGRGLHNIYVSDSIQRQRVDSGEVMRIHSSPIVNYPSHFVITMDTRKFFMVTF